MANEHDPLLRDIEDYLARTGYSHSRFGRLAANNCRLVERMRAGGDVTRSVERSVRAWMEKYPDRRPYERVGK